MHANGGYAGACCCTPGTTPADVLLLVHGRPAADLGHALLPLQVLTKVCVFDAASMSGLDKKYMEQVSSRGGGGGAEAGRLLQAGRLLHRQCTGGADHLARVSSSRVLASAWACSAQTAAHHNAGGPCQDCSIAARSQVHLVMPLVLCGWVGGWVGLQVPLAAQQRHAWERLIKHGSGW